MGRFRHGRGGRFLTAPEKTRQISKIRQIFYDNQGNGVIDITLQKIITKKGDMEIKN